jgi:hypothetical protein
LVTLEVANLRLGEGPAERGHALFPSRIANKGESFDVAKVLQVELQVVPEGAGGPAVEIVHVEEHADPAVLLDELLDPRRELRVVLMGELAAHLHFQHVVEFLAGEFKWMRLDSHGAILSCLCRRIL